MADHQVGQEAGEHNLRGDAERAGSVQPGKTMIREDTEKMGLDSSQGCAVIEQEARDKLKCGEFQL